VRERGVQSRRVRAGNVEPVRRSTPPSRSGTNFWQGLAIVALIAATAGWTTVAVLALRGTTGTTGTAAVATDSPDPNAAAASDAPPSHDVPDLEAFVPTKLAGTAVQVESVTGDSLLGGGDPWSAAMQTFLTSKSKAPSDLQYAFTFDPTQALNVNVGVYRVTGIDSSAVHDALIQAWKAGTAGTTVTQATVGGKAVTKGDDGAGDLSYLYVRDNLVFEVLTNDETAAAAALTALPAPGASTAPHTSASPSAGASTAPAASASPAP
jgi:hypothetical protein